MKVEGAPKLSVVDGVLSGAHQKRELGMGVSAAATSKATSPGCPDGWDLFRP
jgi:hypothetical protein